MDQKGSSGYNFKPSRDQQEIIDYRGGHLQVVACAGSGKTETIARRVASLLAEGVDPRSIVAFTFTERAAASLKARIYQRVAELNTPQVFERIGGMYVGTIHAFCLRILQDNIPAYANFDILDEHRQAGLLSRESHRLKLKELGNGIWRSIADFRRNMDALENELIDPELIVDTPFGERYKDFCDTLERYHFLTYGQLVSRAVAALEDPRNHERIRLGLRYLFVDEYQDVNPAQERLVALLSQPPVKLCVVGDDDQAIYQWRGSEVNNILTFQNRYKGACHKPLSENRRSRPQIIHLANTFANSIQPRLAKEMQPVKEPSGGPEFSCWLAETPDAEGETIATTIERLVAKGFLYKDIAILLRSVKTSSEPIIKALEKHGILFRCAGRTGLFRQAEAIVLGMTFAWLSDNKWRSEKYGQFQPVDFTDLLKEYQKLFSRERWSSGEINDYLNEWYDWAHDDKETANLVGNYLRLLHLLGVNRWNPDDPQVAARMGTMARFSQLLADFEHVTRRARWVRDSSGEVWRGGQNGGSWYYKRLFYYLQYYALDAYEDFEGEDTFGLNAVDLLTVHQAKGLEWPVVFVPCLSKQRFPSRNTGSSQGWLLPESVFDAETRKRYEGSVADERRLFYVAMTRARDMLYLSSFHRINKNMEISPFLHEVAGGTPPMRTSLDLPALLSSSTAPGEEKPTFSFSDLAAYEQCPFGYRLQMSLGFQPQLVPELGYGKTIHHILRRLAEFTTLSQLP